LTAFEVENVPLFFSDVMAVGPEFFSIDNVDPGIDANDMV
jgi:hypothetical protein